jgi:predicted transposase/invertase (TIGR01784 family)
METRRKMVFFDKLTYIYLEMPKFTKTEEQLETHFDKWLYVIKNLPLLQERPRRIQERVFQRLFEAAEIARFDPSERDAYEESIKVYRDLKNVIDTGWEEGREKGREEGREEGRLDRAKEMARRMTAAGEPIAKIVAYTGLTAEQIRQL